MTSIPNLLKWEFPRPTVVDVNRLISIPFLHSTSFHTNSSLRGKCQGGVDIFIHLLYFCPLLPWLRAIVCQNVGKVYYDVINDVCIIHCGVRLCGWILLVCLTMESLWDVDHNVSTALLLVFIRWWGQLLHVAICSTFVCCYWCISILISLTFWRCSLIGLHCTV